MAMSLVTKLKYLVVAGSIVMLGCSQKNTAEPSNEYFQRQPTTLTVAQVEADLGPGKTGHGPYIWYQAAGQRKEYWVWFSKSDSSHGKDRAVVLVTLADASDPDQQSVLWPPSMMGRDVREIMSTLYPN